ncbi:MAG: hypothetical protein FWC16_13625, partial [Defluviitaleaceae bacterium]|nr:hypothetical protein [Defluviitaleaceae bacterium]
PPNFLQKLRGRIFRRNVTAAVLSLVVALVAVLIFAHQWRVPITFDANRMFVEIRDEVVVQSPTGEISWAGTAWLFPPEYTVLHTRETAYFAWQNFGNTGTNARGRDLYRDGERVRVVFIHKTETLWDSLFFNIEAVNWSNGGSFTGTSIYGDDFQTAHPTPKRIEIYYLPVRNIVRLGNLSDESFDAQRANATRIWAGTN